jgi:hypothetical protein
MFRSATVLSLILGLSLLTGCDPKKDSSSAAGAASGSAVAGTPVPTQPTQPAPDSGKDGEIGNKTVSQGSASGSQGTASSPGAANDAGTGSNAADFNGATSALDKINGKIR